MSQVIVTLKKNPDGSPVLTNTIMRGAMPDYKATCANLAAQILALNHALDEAQSVEASLRSVIGGKEMEITRNRYATEQLMNSNRTMRVALLDVRGHWSHGWSGTDIKGKVSRALNQ